MKIKNFTITKLTIGRGFESHRSDQNMYICQYCNKILDNHNSFIAHERFCKLNPNYQKNLNQIHSAAKLGGKIYIEKYKKYNSTKITKVFECEKCGKKFSIEYTELQLKHRKKFPRFCSTYCSHSNKHSDATKQKISDSVKNSIKNGILKNPRVYHKTTCVVCGKEFPYRTTNGKKLTCSRECYHKLLSQKIQERIKSGSHKGWQSRNILSYPEKFWIKVLQNNNIEYKANFPIKKHDLDSNLNYNCYFLDFLLQNKIDLEIDGDQHKYRKESDIKRDELLIKNGYIVYRIDWNEINSENGKKLMKDKIDKFLTFYKEHINK